MSYHVEGYFELGCLCLQEGLPEEAVSYLEKSTDLAAEIGLKPYLRDGYLYLAECRETLDDARKAHHYLELCAKLNTGILDEARTRTLTELLTFFLIVAATMAVGFLFSLWVVFRKMDRF